MHFNDLPNELAEIIFKIYLADRDRWSYPCLYALMLTCKAWRRVILECPYFWSTIAIEFPKL